MLLVPEFLLGIVVEVTGHLVVNGSTLSPIVIIAKAVLVVMGLRVFTSVGMVTVNVLNLLEWAQVVCLMMVTVVTVSGILRGLLLVVPSCLQSFLFVELLGLLLLLFVLGLVALMVIFLVTVITEVIPFAAVCELLFNVGLFFFDTSEPFLVVPLLGSETVLVLGGHVMRVA